MARPLAILVHGMCRSPLSMALLARALRRAGFATASFGYLVSVEKYEPCRQRLLRYIASRTAGRPYVLIGHSLGTVLLRAVLPQLASPPAGLFLIAPPTQACHLARRLHTLALYRWITGEMGQLLASERFMRGIPVPRCPCWIYAGTAGSRRRFYPIGDEVNDFILKVSETQLPGIETVHIDGGHTFLMNAATLVQDLLAKARAVVADPPVVERC